MARPNTKEYLACLAFAYFMKNRDYRNDSHKEEWIDIFRDFKSTEVKNDYREYLEPDFRYSDLKSQYSFNTGSGNPHLYAIYNQMVSLFESNLLDNVKKYKIYGQDSTFVQTVKDKCLKRLLNVFSESFSSKAKGQDLTPADFYIVDSTKVEDIRRKFNDAIIKPKNDTTLILNYQKNREETYEQLILHYFKRKELIPISHKMPSGKDPVTSIKVAGNISKIGNVNKKNIDPYSQLLVALNSKRPSEVEKLIDDIIEIKYDLWDVRENKSSSSWKLIFDFNYKKIDPNFDDSRFALEPLPSGGSGSFNGKFFIQKGQKVQTPWVAGMSPNSLKPFLKSYSGYNQIMNRLAKLRKVCLDETILNEIQKEVKTKSESNKKLNDIKKLPEYKTCERFISNSNFHTYNDFKKNVFQLFVKIGKLNLFDEYQKGIIKKIRREGSFSANVGDIDPKRLSEHYISLQMSYFLFVGGQSFRQFLKKSIFFTIFGAITKRGFTAIGNSGAINLVKKKIKIDGMLKEVEVSLTAAPHAILL